MDGLKDFAKGLRASLPELGAALRPTLGSLHGFIDRLTAPFGPRQRFLVALAAASMVLGATSALAWNAWRNMATVQNVTGHRLDWIELSFGGESRRIENVPPGAQVEFPWRAAREGGLAVRGELSDGTSFAAEGGFVSEGGYGEKARVVIEPAGTVRVDVDR